MLSFSFKSVSSPKLLSVNHFAPNSCMMEVSLSVSVPFFSAEFSDASANLLSHFTKAEPSLLFYPPFPVFHTLPSPWMTNVSHINSVHKRRMNAHGSLSSCRSSLLVHPPSSLWWSRDSRWNNYGKEKERKTFSGLSDVRTSKQARLW